MPGHWIADASAASCEACYKPFSLTNRRHHCRDCGGVFCDACTIARATLSYRSVRKPERLCAQCVGFANMFDEVFEGKIAHRAIDSGLPSRTQVPQGTGVFDLETYAASFVRGSAVGIKRRSRSSDDLNFSMLPEDANNLFGDRRPGAVEPRPFPENRQVYPHLDFLSIVMAPPVTTPASTALFNMKGNFAAALQDALRGHGSVASAADDVQSTSSSVRGDMMPVTGTLHSAASLQVADFASYY
jgi:hypothetical protein